RNPPGPRCTDGPGRVQDRADGLRGPCARPCPGPPCGRGGCMHHAPPPTAARRRRPARRADRVPVSIDWAEVYRATYRDLVRFLHRKVWDAERAQDLAQEAFVRALHQQPDNPRAWLFTVAANLARDEARSVVRRRKHLALLRTEREAEPALAAPAADDALERSERLEAVRRSLDALSERDREVLLLWDAGLSYAEIAEQTGLALGAIGTTLARARRRLVEAYATLEEKHVARG